MQSEFLASIVSDTPPFMPFSLTLYMLNYEEDVVVERLSLRMTSSQGTTIHDKRDVIECDTALGAWALS